MATTKMQLKFPEIPENLGNYLRAGVDAWA
jgi:hypothetical protein